MWLNMICSCAIYVDRNQRVFLAQMTLFVVCYDVIHHFLPINSQYLMMWGLTARFSSTLLLLLLGYCYCYYFSAVYRMI